MGDRQEDRQAEGDETGGQGKMGSRKGEMVGEEKGRTQRGTARQKAAPVLGWVRGRSQPAPTAPAPLGAPCCASALS